MSETRKTLNLYKHICLRNGILEWKTLKLYPRTSKFVTATQLPVEWDPEATCPNWERLLTEWIPDKNDIRFLQEFVGLCLIPDTSFHTALFLFGDGSGGKSTFIHAVEILFGDALAGIPLDRLSIKYEIPYLQDKLVNVCGDVDAQHMRKKKVLEAMVDGDNLRGKHKFGSVVDFASTARLIFSASRLPRATGRKAWFKKYKLVEFPRHFKHEPAWQRRVKEQLGKEKSGILRWAVEGLRRLNKNKKFTISKTMREYQGE